MALLGANGAGKTTTLKAISGLLLREDGAVTRGSIEFDGQRLELTLGSKTCGVVRITDGKMTSWLVKAANEVEGITDTVRLALGDQTIEQTGDFSFNG